MDEVMVIHFDSDGSVQIDLGEWFFDPKHAAPKLMEKLNAPLGEVQALLRDAGVLEEEPDIECGPQCDLPPEVL